MKSLLRRNLQRYLKIKASYDLSEFTFIKERSQRIARARQYGGNLHKVQVMDSGLLEGSIEGVQMRDRAEGRTRDHEVVPGNHLDPIYSLPIQCSSTRGSCTKGQYIILHL